MKIEKVFTDEELDKLQVGPVSVYLHKNSTIDEDFITIDDYSSIVDIKEALHILYTQLENDLILIPEINKIYFLIVDEKSCINWNHNKTPMVIGFSVIEDSFYITWREEKIRKRKFVKTPEKLSSIFSKIINKNFEDNILFTENPSDWAKVMIELGFVK